MKKILLCLLIIVLAALPALAEAVSADAIDPAVPEAGDILLEAAADDAPQMAASSQIPSISVTGRTAAAMNVGDRLQIVPAAPVSAYKSSKAQIATVSEDGVVTAVAAGKAKITIVAVNGKKLVLALTVVDPTLPTGIALDRTGAVTIDLREPLQLGFALQPSGAVSAVTWKSSAAKVAAVSQTGLVTPLKAGKATITATTDRGKKSAKVKLVIVDKHAPTSLRITAAGSELPVNGTLQLTPVATAELEPAIATYTWKTSNKKVATVSSSGLVTGHSAGSAKITAISSNRIRAIYTVNVTEDKPSGDVTDRAELSQYLGLPISYARQKLGGDLKQKGSGYAFTGGQMTVASNADQTVIGIGLDSAQKKYTLFGAKIGDMDSKAATAFEKYGWYFYSQTTPAMYDVEITTYLNSTHKGRGLELEVRSDAGRIFSIWVYDPEGTFNQ